MKKSEKLKPCLSDRQAKRKINFKYFFLAHMLTLFFVVAPIVSAADKSADEKDNFFNFNQKSAYSEPFSKLIEFLNDKKNELEKYDGDFLGGKALLIDTGLRGSKSGVDEAVFNPAVSSFVSAAFESVKNFVADNPKQYFGIVFDSVKSFIFPGDSQNDFEYNSPSSESSAREMENLKQQYAEAIDEANVISQKFILLQNELEKIKAGGVIVRQPVIEQKTVEKTIEKIVSGLSQSDLDSGLSSLKTELNNLNANLTNQINNLSSNTSRQTSAVYQAVSLTNKIDSLSGVRLSNITVSGVSGLADSDIPDGITASNYLPLTGGTVSGDLTVTGNTTLGSLILISQSATAGYFTATSTTASTFPYASTTALTVSGSAYIGSLNGPLQANNGLVSATTSVGSVYGGTGLNSSALTGIAQIVNGTWSASSTLSTAFGGTGWNNLQANTVLLGNGAGRISTTTAGTDGYVLGLSSGVPTWLATSTLSTITGTLAVSKGGTGQTSFGQGWLNSDGTTLSASTSPTVNYIVATSTTATSTFPYLSVTTNSNLGTVVGGTWNGTAVGDAYLTKSGDWTGTLDTYEASSLLARANHTGTQGVATLSNYDWTFSNNYGAINLTGSSTKPIWAQGGINASSTSNFVYASTTALTVSGNSYLGTVSSGIWNGTAIGNAYVDDDITLTNITQITNRAISDTTGTLAVARGGTGQTSFGQGWLNSDGTTLSASTSPTVNYIVATSTTATSTFPYLSVTTNSNLGTVVGGTWNGTDVSSTYGGTGLNSSALTGLAQIVAGTWSASSTLSTAFGGTGWNNLQANTVLLGNGAGRLATTTAGTDGYVLGLSSGVPVWLATSTLSTITGTLAVSKGGTGATSLTGLLQGNGTSAITGIAGTAGQFPYYNGTDTLLATSSLFLATSGNVGIGTTTPNALLYVKGTGTFGTSPTDTTNIQGLVKIYDANSTASSGDGNLVLHATDAVAADMGGNLVFSASGPSTGGNLNQPYATIKGAREDADASGNHQGYLLFATSRNDSTLIERMRIDSAGNVGIGEVAPTEPLHIKTATGAVGIKVESTAATNVGPTLTLDHNSASPAAEDIVGRLYWTGRRADGNSYWTSYIDSVWTDPATLVGTSRLAFHVRNGDNDTTAMTIAHSGNVGIGEVAPTEPLQIKTATGAVGIKVESTATTNVGPILTLDHNSASPAAEDIVGRLYWTGRRADNNSYWTSYIDSVWTDPATLVGTSRLAFHVRNGDTDTTAMTIAHSGNVGIGTTTPWRTLSVTGTVGFDGLTSAVGAGSLCLDSNKQVVYNSASDACLSSTRATKRDISSLAVNGISLINQLQPSSFIYNQGDGRTRYGFIAEDTAVADDRLTTHNEKGEITGIDDRAIMSVAVKAIKELNLKVSDLQASAAASGGQGSDGLFAWITDKFKTVLGITFENEKVKVKNLCVGETCVTEEQFKAVFGGQSSASSQSSSISSGESSSSLPAGEAGAASSSASSTSDALPSQSSSSTSDVIPASSSSSSSETSSSSSSEASSSSSLSSSESSAPVSSSSEPTTVVGSSSSSSSSSESSS